MEPNPPDFLGVEVLARRLGISASALHKQRCNGSGPPYCKVGARVLYRWSDVVDWLEARKERSVRAHRALAKREPALPRKLPSASA